MELIRKASILAEHVPPNSGKVSGFSNLTFVMKLP